LLFCFRLGCRLPKYPVWPTASIDPNH
jgi:hypothetical protein